MGKEALVQELFEDFAQRFVRGEGPDVRDYLRRADDRAEELGRLIDRYLASVAPSEPRPERVELMRAWLAGEPPLLELRRGRGVPRDRIVDALIAGLGLAREKREKVRFYYHRLETGQLDPARVDRRVFDVVARVLEADVGELLTGWRPAQLPAPAAFLRAAEDARPEIPEEPEEWDEIDEVFTSGR